jgi:hypothetical protein
MGLGSLGVGIVGIALRNGALEVISLVMLLICITFCILDALVTVNLGGEKNQVFNWVSSFRDVRRPEDDDSYYDV